MPNETLWSVGLWFDFGGGLSESDSVEVWATSRDNAIVEALSQVSGGRLGLECAKVSPSITSCVEVLRSTTREDRLNA